VPLVEAPRALVLLEDPEDEAVGTQRLRLVEQRGAYPAVLSLGIDVEFLEDVPAVAL